MPADRDSALKGWEARRKNGYKPPPLSADARRRMGDSHRGRTDSAETRAKKSASLRALWGSKIHPLKGRTQSEDHKRKVAATVRARVARGDAAPFQGRKHSEETLAKMRASASSAEERMRRSERAKLQNAAAIRPNKPTAPELATRRRLQALGLEFVEQFRLPGYPFVYDFAIPSRKLLIEVDGCYWHGCPSCREPGKEGHAVQDRRKTGVARKSGWNILRIPTCRMKLLEKIQ